MFSDFAGVQLLCSWNDVIFFHCMLVQMGGTRKLASYVPGTFLLLKDWEMNLSTWLAERYQEQLSHSEASWSQPSYLYTSYIHTQ